ncbi:hypothetical protein ACH5RR_021535 [Cinchona calisaya]|uniref:Uncharacterized protein n=1 Tax=Cinchona calisaya TaxID=153742 RepID=A0ABD2ZHK0_9GENT
MGFITNEELKLGEDSEKEKQKRYDKKKSFEKNCKIINHTLEDKIVKLVFFLEIGDFPCCLVIDEYQEIFCKNQDEFKVSEEAKIVKLQESIVDNSSPKLENRCLELEQEKHRSIEMGIKDYFKQGMEHELASLEQKTSLLLKLIWGSYLGESYSADLENFSIFTFWSFESFFGNPLSSSSTIPLEEQLLPIGASSSRPSSILLSDVSSIMSSLTCESVEENDPSSYKREVICALAYAKTKKELDNVKRQLAAVKGKMKKAGEHISF